MPWPGRGKRIAEAREARGWSQTDLARRAGTRQATISNWERFDDRKIREPDLMALAAALETSVEWIQEGRPPTMVREQTVGMRLTGAAKAEVGDTPAARLAALEAAMARVNDAMAELGESLKSLRLVQGWLRGETSGSTVRQVFEEGPPPEAPGATDSPGGHRRSG